MSTRAYVVSSVRTAVGRAKRGALRNTRPEHLGAVAVRGALARVEGLDAARVDDVVLGCAFPEGPQGMNVARVVAQRAGLPDQVPGETINRFCSSGLQAIAHASQAISCGHADVVVAGGVESMSRVPMVGFHFAPDPTVVQDRADNYISMGVTAENVARQHEVSRQAQDAFALRSHQRALAALQSGVFRDEVVPVPLRDTVFADGRATTAETTFEVDEGPRADTAADTLARLRPAFHGKGTVTAGNASQMSDGAAATVLMSERAVEEAGATPLARLAGYAVAGVAPNVMGIGPIEAIPRALRQAGIGLSDVGLIELNEAFASQALAVIRALDLNDEIVNVHGGAIALGHPLGCTGAKLTSTLLHEMARREVRYGVVTMCIGGGMGAAGVFERVS